MEKITYQFELIRAIRKFFDEKAFTEVITPPVVENPGMETHIHPFKVTRAKDQKLAGYLHTSPEFTLKEILGKSSKIESLYSLGYCFRDEPSSPIHRNQFLMLEWYRRGAFYTQIMDDIESLIKELQNNLNSKSHIKDFPRITVQKIIQDIDGLNILEFLDTNELLKKLRLDYKDIPLPSEKCSWDDYFFLYFLNKVEPHFKEYPYLLLYEFPAPLAALSTLKESNPNVCERFEVYLNGLELCNCFNELTDFHLLKERFLNQAEEKKNLYGYELPWPKRFMQMMENGYPKSSGVALGVERLLTSLMDIEDPFLI